MKTEEDFKPIAEDTIRKYMESCLCKTTPEENVNALTALIGVALHHLELCTSKEQFSFYMGLDE